MANDPIDLGEFRQRSLQQKGSKQSDVTLALMKSALATKNPIMTVVEIVRDLSFFLKGCGVDPGELALELYRVVTQYKVGELDEEQLGYIAEARKRAGLPPIQSTSPDATEDC
jgi:hypothetical protein